jgi:hypothetical protein
MRHIRHDGDRNIYAEMLHQGRKPIGNDLLVRTTNEHGCRPVDVLQVGLISASGAKVHHQSVGIACRHRLQPLRGHRVADDGKPVEPVNAQPVEPGNRNDARDRDIGPATGARAQSWRSRENGRKKHVAVKQRTIGTASEANGEPRAGRESDKRAALAAPCWPKLADKVREVVIQLPDVVDVATTAGAAMASNVQHIGRNAGGTQRLRENVHAGPRTGRAVDQNSHFVRFSGIGVILKIDAIPRLEVPRCRNARVVGMP